MNLFFNRHCPPGCTSMQLRAIKEAYRCLYSYAGADFEDHFIFTSSGAEGVNHAVFSAYLDITRKSGKNHFLCSNLSNAPAIMAMSRLQECACIFQMVGANSRGFIDCKTVVDMITPRTAMLSLSCVNHLTGVVQPLDAIAAICKERDILLHLDATHMLAKGDFSFRNSGADILTFDGMSAGVGGMFIRTGREISPMILGGNEQAQMRAGGYVALLLEFAKSVKEEQSQQDHYYLEIARLRSLFEEKICASCQDAKVLFHQEKRVPHITSLIFPGITSDLLFHALLQKGVYSSFGGGQMQLLSHVLKACKIEAPTNNCALSFAFSHELTEEEIDRGATIIIQTVEQLQKYSIFMMQEVYPI